MSKLKNPRWEQFITTYHANGHIARDAYAVAYPHVQKIDSRDAAAARLLRTPAVIRRLAELQDGTAKRAEISVETQIAKLEKLRLKAERAGQLAVAHSCVVSAAKLAGIWVEKSENQT